MRAGYEKVRAAGIAVPEASVDGVLVTPMRTGGAELSAGVTVDPAFGPVLAVGLGGIWVEVLNDTSLRLLPVDAAEVRRMLGELRGLPLLQGARGAAPADLDAVAEAIAGLGEVALTLNGALNGALRALEVNPLWVNGDQVEALDVLVITEARITMILGVSAEQEELRASVRRFLADRAPLSRVRELMDDGETDWAVWEQAGSQLGLLGLAIPEAYGVALRLRRAGDRARGVRRRAVRRPVPGQRPSWPPRRCWPARTRAPGAGCCPTSPPGRPSRRSPSPRTAAPGTRPRSGCPRPRTARPGGWTGTRASCSTAPRPG